MGWGIIQNIHFYKTQNRILKKQDIKSAYRLECAGIQRAKLKHSVCQNLNIKY